MKLGAVIAAGILVLALPAHMAWGQQLNPPWEIRTYLGPGPADPDPTAVYTDTAGSSTWQYNMSKVMGRWVCPKCGYSTPVVDDPTNPPYCPNPWLVPGHGNVRLRFQPVRECFLSSTGVPVTDPAGNDVIAILGKPFHPTTPVAGGGAAQQGSAVHIAIAGLQNAHDVNANDTNGDFVRFAVVMPGAKFPAARPHNVTGDVGIDENDVHLNPLRVTDNEVYHVQVFFATDWVWILWIGWRPLSTVTVIRVYSNLDGLVFYGTYRELGTERSILRQRDVWIVTATGSAVIRIPKDLGHGPGYTFGNEQPPSAGWFGRRVTDPAMVSTFTVRSNTVIIPHDEDPTTDPADFTQFPSQWSTFGDFCTQQDWPLKHNCFRIPSAGRVADWLTNVVGSGSPVQKPYVVPAGATGKGTVYALWQAREASEGGAGGYQGIIDNPYLINTQISGGDLWWWYEGAEWNYDWLEESGSAAAYQHLWGNCRAVVNQTDLETEHTPNAGGGYRDTDPPWQNKSSFIVSRLHIPPTGTQWAHGAVTEPAELDPDPNTGHAVVVIGEQSGSTISGSYEPGTRTPDRWIRLDSRKTPVLRCPNCFSSLPLSATGTCPYCGAAVSASDRIDGYARMCIDVDRPPGIDLPQSPRSGQPAHATIPDTALEAWPHIGWYAPGDLDRRMRLAYHLPKYLPPSVPPGANPAINDFDNDHGYRGRLVIFHRPYGPEITPDMTGRRPRLQFNWRWDAAYRCPACGAWQNQPGQCANASCQGTRVCPVCATVAGPGVSKCPFCGHNMKTWGRTDTFAGLDRVGPDDIDCEEYEPFELAVSVLRKLDLASKVAGVDLGRVAPGVRPDQPDTTVAASPAARPEPSEVSPPAQTAVVNEGNISVAARLRGTNLTRAGVDPSSVSRDYEAARYPLTVGTIYAADAAGNGISDANPLLAATQEPGGAEGFPAATWLQAGWLLPGSYKPVPLGQPAGTHTGTAILFQDLDGDGALDFYDTSAGAVTDTSAATFDPAADLPLEPVASVDLRLRVAETPVPDNDYFAPDGWPALAFGYDNNWDANSFQLVFGSTRPPGPAIGAASNHYTAPPANQAEAQARASKPVNLFYLSADKITDPGDPLYTRYAWRQTGANIEPAHTLTADTAAGTVNAAPSAVDRRFLDHNWLTLWHRARPTDRGWELTLRANMTGSADYGSSGETFMFTGRALSGLRGVVSAGELWAFWHSGKPGQERIYYLRGFDPAHPKDGQELPVVNSYGNRPHHEQARVWLSDSSASSVMAHRPARSPFVYVKDPSPWMYAEPLPGGGTDVVVNVAFSGYLRWSGNADICWVKFRRDMMGNPDDNWGKKAFPRIADRLTIPNTTIRAGEEMKSDIRRQTFRSQHLDWVVHDNGPGANFGNAPDPSLQDPRFRLAVVADVAGDKAPPKVWVYEITWQHSDERWNRARNAYFVEPRFELLASPDGSDVLAPRAYPGDSAPYRLVDPPSARQPQPRPLLMEINHAAGVVRFSSPMFNAEVPNDQSAVVNTGVVADAADVVMYIDYTPLIWRITTDPADDDCPRAYWTPENGYLAFFWRRTYAVGQAPHWGRSSFVYKLWAPAVSLRHPPVTAGPTVEVWDGSNWNTLASSLYTVNSATGSIIFKSMQVNSLPWRVRVTYNGMSQPEYHTAPGWTQERRVEVETELVSGPFVVRPEHASLNAPSGNSVPAVRFWLAWSSPRVLLDLRPVGAGGGSLRQSADIYTAVVVPDLNAAVAEPPTVSISTDPT